MHPFSFNPQSPLERETYKILVALARGYAYPAHKRGPIPLEAWKSAAEDLLHGGCASGLIGALIYHADTNKFFARHEEEITDLLVDLAEQMGSSGPATILRDWNDADPFARKAHNRDLLAWFGFETTAQQLLEDAGVIE